MENDLIISPQNTLAISEKMDFSELIKPLQKELLLLETYVAGTAYIEDESIVDDLKVGDRLTLKREPSNKFDEKAILVLDNQKRKVGYIPEKDNTVFARLMDGGKMLFCKVDGKQNKGFYTQVDVGIYLEDF